MKSYIITFLLLCISLGAKAIDGYTGGYHASGIDGTTVYLNDLEDHTWTYYSGVDESVDGGYYNNIKNYGRVTTDQGDYLRLYSPNPRNVTIEYDANGGEVSIAESQTKFIYYKTLEESATSGEYKYQVISNPFSKRPTGNGFAGWEIVSGGEYIKGHNDGDVLSLDENIVFNNLATGYTTNCMSATIKLKAKWTEATTTYITSAQTITFTGGTYETNFVVMKASFGGTITVSSPCTIMMVEPDGTADYRSYTFSGTLSPNNDGVTKMEWTNWKSSNNICSNQHNLTLGRGLPVNSQCAKVVYGINANCTSPKYTIKVESGKYNEFYFYGNGANYNGTCTTQYTIGGDAAHVIAVAGNDYDRANGNNGNLLFTQRFCSAPGMKFAGYYGTISNPDNYKNKHTIDAIVKSGKILPYIWVEDPENKKVSAIDITHYNYCFYLGNQNYDSHMGGRNVLIEGGEICTIAGGSSNHGLSRDTDSPNIFTLRMKGGTVHGSIYGGGGYFAQTSDIIYAITGGKIVGWVGSGCNGTTDAAGGENQGQQVGIAYEYIGGKAEVNSENSTKVLGYHSTGGYVFGAGAGRDKSPKMGRLDYGTNVVIADNAYVERDVFAGGDYGYSAATSKVYVTGGTVGGKVFGGANQNKESSSNVDIYMTGGNVNGGVYGGSNTSGTTSGYTNLKILGGTVGSTTTNANVHGGGYGSSTIVTGNVDVTIGGTATVNGSVYGGSALGKTNNANTTSNRSKTTKVTMTGGTINGSLFGAGQGSTAAVITNPVITMSSGTVTQNVFGGGDAAKVDGNTSVTIKGPSHVGNNVYGGGNAAEVTGTTNVQIGEKKE